MKHLLKGYGGDIALAVALVFSLTLSGCLLSSPASPVGALLDGDIPDGANITICSGENACPRLEGTADAPVVTQTSTPLAPNEDTAKVECIRDLPLPQSEVTACSEGSVSMCQRAIDMILAGQDSCVGTVDDEPWWKVW